MSRIRIASVSRDQFPVWKPRRETLYSDLDPWFHDREIAWLFTSDQAACFFARSDERHLAIDAEPRSAEAQVRFRRIGFTRLLR